MPKKKLSKKAKHNAWVREQRKLGVLPNFDGTYNKPPKVKPKKKRIKLKQNPMSDEKRWKKEAEVVYKKVKLSKNGSVLGNKYASWNYPFNKLTDKDY